jgi:hypothetical protein
MTVKPCIDCGGPRHTGSGARSRCRSCYLKWQRKNPSPMKAYKRWLFSEPRIDAGVAARWAAGVVAMYDDNMTEAARVGGCDVEVIRRLLDGTKVWVTASIAERLANELGRNVEFAECLPDTGKDDWSEFGRSCGDGSVLGDGCGSWFHEHMLEGLCEECWNIACGFREGPTRDVRLTLQKEAAA